MKYLAGLLAMVIAMSAAQASAQTMDSMPGHNMPIAGSLPIMPGQDAFGAIQEIVRILEADPKTDWSKVNVDALREHLVDMNEVTLRADVAVEHIDGGIRAAVTGMGRTLQAIQRMVPAQARELNRIADWNSKAEQRPNGIVLTVTSPESAQALKIQGLGFIGVMAAGSHHQMHHLAMARGEIVP